ADTAAPHDDMASHDASRTAAWTADVRESARAIARRLEEIKGVETRDQCSCVALLAMVGSHATRQRRSARQGERGTTGASRQERRDGWCPPLHALVHALARQLARSL